MATVMSGIFKDKNNQESLFLAVWRNGEMAAIILTPESVWRRKEEATNKTLNAV